MRLLGIRYQVAAGMPGENMTALVGGGLAAAVDQSRIGEFLFRPVRGNSAGQLKKSRLRVAPDLASIARSPVGLSSTTSTSWPLWSRQKYRPQGRPAAEARLGKLGHDVRFEDSRRDWRARQAGRRIRWTATTPGAQCRRVQLRGLDEPLAQIHVIGPKQEDEVSWLRAPESQACAV